MPARSYCCGGSGKRRSRKRSQPSSDSSSDSSFAAIAGTAFLAISAKTELGPWEEEYNGGRREEAGI